MDVYANDVSRSYGQPMGNEGMKDGTCIKWPKDIFVGCLLRNKRTQTLYRVVSPSNTTEINKYRLGFEPIGGEGDLQLGDELVFIADDKPNLVGGTELCR